MEMYWAMQCSTAAEQVKLPTASAVVADIVDMTKHKNTNIYIDWSPEKLTLVDYKDSVNSFFVRTSSGKETIENAFGSVEYADAGIAGEIGFTTKRYDRG